MTIKEKFGSLALVTGASAGIGKAFARALAAEGIDLILVARRMDDLERLKTELESAWGVSVQPVAADLSKEDFLSIIQTSIGNRVPDILINNAGYGTSGYFHEIDGDTETAMIKVNCIAPVALTRHFLPNMLKQNKGALIFLSSIAANQPSPLGITYSATKVFDLFLGEGLHKELEGTGVAVLTVQPGATSTEFQKVADYNAIKGSRSAEDVVQTALRALGRKRTVVDGLNNRFMTLLARILPRSVAISAAQQWTNRYRKHGEKD